MLHDVLPGGKWRELRGGELNQLSKFQRGKLAIGLGKRALKKEPEEVIRPVPRLRLFPGPGYSLRNDNSAESEN
jgi:hypothetical protein